SQPSSSPRSWKSLASTRRECDFRYVVCIQRDAMDTYCTMSQELAFRRPILTAVKDLRARTVRASQPDIGPYPGQPGPSLPDMPQPPLPERPHVPETPEPRRYPIHPDLPVQPIHEPNVPIQPIHEPGLPTQPMHPPTEPERTPTT